MQLQIIQRQNHPISRQNIDPDALKVLYRLYREGHTAYLVGGGVRDMLLGRSPKDFDVATSARPSQIKKLFKRSCRLVGKRFRLAHVCFGRDKIIEVSTFRRTPDTESGARESETGNDDGYISSDNTFGTPEQDALRRDFTINSMFYNIGDFSLYDYCGGMRDLHDRVIRTIGDPQVRFREDPVRMIRAIKFCARLGFRMDAATWQGITDNCAALAKASVARVQEEIRRLLESHCALRSFDLLDESGLLEQMIPELSSYLDRAGQGEVQDDPEGELLWGLLDLLDKHIDEIEGREERRNLAIKVLMLPLVVETGLLRGSGAEETAAELVNAFAGRLGICNRLRAQAHETYAVLAQLMQGKSGKSALFGREVFPQAFLLYRMLVTLNLGEAAQVERWQQRWEEYRNRQHESLDKAAAQSYSQKREKRRRSGRRRPHRAKE